MNKYSVEKRISIANELKPYDKDKIKDETLRLVKECIDIMGVNATPQLVCFDEVPPYDKMPKDKTRGWVSLIFIHFTTDGYIAVVGAGKDINFDFSYDSVTGQILKALNHKWDEESLIIIPVYDLKAVGASSVENVFESRNGVEHYIGEYLYGNGIPILNEWSHRNYTKVGWNRISDIRID